MRICLPMNKWFCYWDFSFLTVSIERVWWLIGGRDVVEGLLDLLLTGYKVADSVNVGPVDAAGASTGCFFTLHEAMRSGILYYQRHSAKAPRFSLVAPALQLCRVWIRLSPYEFPASGPIDPAHFEHVIAQRESALANVVSRYGNGTVSLREAFGDAAYMNDELKRARMRMLHRKPLVLREAVPFFKTSEKRSGEENPGRHQKAVVKHEVAVAGLATLIDIRGGSCILLCDGANKLPCPHLDVRYVRGDPSGPKEFLFSVYAKRLLTATMLGLKFVQSWYEGVKKQMVLYEKEYRVIYVIIASCDFHDKVKDFVKSQNDLVIVDKNGLASYLPIVGQRSVLLKYEFEA
ncbi:hypothetical protein KFL_004360120 [Klebsormidium nitens]|uniref:Uncharacterized protein n=1 Tax=Klebsormidium nitens TaxID=105231 RepID=A0A1Y1IC91_KLENI|nr:hypothetical protein KFL_004360120 [Klebsormidium nitens]|eukprot:GAQ88530.1 hypothetical protein KFL_004360120 [Klebsormidium nitens]